MKKKYTRKPIRNLNELEKAQDRTRAMYKDMESDWVSNFVQPDTWAFSLGQHLLTGLVKRKSRNKTAHRSAESFIPGTSANRSRRPGHTKDLPEPEKSGLLSRLATVAGVRRGKAPRTDRPNIPARAKSAASRLLKNLIWSLVYWQAFRIGFRLGRAGGRAVRSKKNRR